MRSLFVLVILGALAAALGSAACGDGNKPPPLTPDSDHASAEGTDGGK